MSDAPPPEPAVASDEPFPLAPGGADAGPAPTRADWERAAAGVLRKARRLGDDDPDEAVWERLTRTTLDGVPVAPLGTLEQLDGLDLGARPPARGDGWDIRVAFADPDPRTTAEQAVADLENGATSLWLQVGPTGLAHDDLGDALRDVLLDVAPVVLETDGDTLPAAETLVGILHERDLHPAPGTNLGADPIGAAVRRGRREADLGDAVAVARLAAEHGVLGLVVDGTAVHDLGASDAQELGFAMAVAAAYLRALEEAGVDAPAAADLMEFQLAATDEQFPTIAKLRAARRLWTRMLELSGVAEDRRTMRLHAVTSRPMMSRYDPWVNMLRTCVAAFAAGVGGADAVTVLPYDAPLGLPDGFSRRIARNTSSLLIDEGHVATVTDPAGGAYAVERLTADLADAAWAELGRIEQAGGPLADEGLAERIATVAAERDRQVATRERPLTGLTEFPHLEETRPERRPYAEHALTVKPYGHAFEALRDRPAERPVLLATMGSVAAHTARASFAANLLAAGGIETETTGATDGTGDVLAAYDAQPVVCLCGPDPAYEEWGRDLVTALREAGARRVLLAGSSRTAEQVGTDDSCALGVDALAFLRRTREALDEREETSR